MEEVKSILSRYKVDSIGLFIIKPNKYKFSSENITFFHLLMISKSINRKL